MHYNLTGVNASFVPPKRLTKIRTIISSGSLASNQIYYNHNQSIWPQIEKNTLIPLMKECNMQNKCNGYNWYDWHYYVCRTSITGTTTKWYLFFFQVTMNNSRNVVRYLYHGGTYSDVGDEVWLNRKDRNIYTLVLKMGLKKPMKWMMKGMIWRSWWLLHLQKHQLKIWSGMMVLTWLCIKNLQQSMKWGI